MGGSIYLKMDLLDMRCLIERGWLRGYTNKAVVHSRYRVSSSTSPASDQELLNASGKKGPQPKNTSSRYVLLGLLAAL